MEEKVGLVFSWDPKSKAWVKERGPDDAAPPPAPPIDDGAVQTYFLDPTNGRWQATILGLRARQIAADLKTAYRSPVAPGLAMVEAQQRNPRLEVWQEKQGRTSGSRAPFIVAVAGLVFVVGAGAFAAQAFLAAPNDAAASDASPKVTTPKPSTAPGAASVAPGATGTASAQPSVTAAPTNAATEPPVTRTVAPTPPPAPTTIRLSGRTPTSGVAIFYTGPNIVTQNIYFNATFTAVLANGSPSGATMNVRLGSGTTVNARTDGSGTYTASIPANCPVGPEPLTVFYGNSAEQLVLGNLTVK